MDEIILLGSPVTKGSKKKKEIKLDGDGRQVLGAKNVFC